MNELLNQPLAAIVTKNFRAAQVFEKYGLDFCCKGNRSLGAACEEKSIVTADILDELNLALATDKEENDYLKMSTSELADYIVNVHHSYVNQNVPLILNYLFKVASKHGDRFPFMKKVFVIFSQVRTELNHHMVKEEELVFPVQIEEEHDVAGSLLNKIRELTNNYEAPDHACTTFRLVLNLLREFEADLHKHVYLENHILFPRAIEFSSKLEYRIM